MPDEENKLVPIDTSGPDATVDIEEVKEEAVIEQPEENTETGTEEPVKEEAKKSDEELEDYSKGVQSRIAKLTRKMREAERREQAALDYAKGVEEKRQILEKRFEKTDSEYVKKFETSISSGLEAAQKELATAIESGDAAAQVEANKRIATLAFENAKLEQTKAGREEQQAEKPVLSQPPVQTRQVDEPNNPDPRAEAWASNNSWFGTDKAMTYTAFEIHKDLTEKEGYDPNSNEYYAEVDKRIRVDFPHKFGTTNNKQTAAPVQTVASASRSVKPGRKTVRLTSSQVAIAKKLGVPLEEYAKQLKYTRKERKMENENKNTSRANQTRSKSERPKVWVPPSSLDAPPAPDGFRYRWIRAESVGFQDTKNITGRIREGYELVRAEEVENASDYPVLDEGKYKGVIGVGGLLLAKVPTEIAQQRQDYMANRHKQRDEAVNNDLMKEQDSRMPINVERQSRVTFGGTKK